MDVTSLLDLDATALIGRDPSGVVEDYGDHDSPEATALTLAEHRALEAMLQTRGLALAPTRSRTIAVELVPALASVCRTPEAVDLLLLLTRDWIDGMGDIRGFARQVEAMRLAGDPVRDAVLTVPLSFNAQAGLDVHEGRMLIAKLVVHRRPPVVVGVHEIDDDQDAAERTPTPELVA